MHSRFKLPVPTLEDSTCALRANSLEAEEIPQAKLVIWDEAPMPHSYMLEAVDRLLRDLMDCQTPFGGKVMVRAVISARSFQLSATQRAPRL